jgi:hypothetical protein
VSKAQVCGLHVTVPLMPTLIVGHNQGNRAGPLCIALCKLACCARNKYGTLVIEDAYATMTPVSSALAACPAAPEPHVGVELE